MSYPLGDQIYTIKTPIIGTLKNNATADNRFLLQNGGTIYFLMAPDTGATFDDNIIPLSTVYTIFFISYNTHNISFNNKY